MLRDLGLVGSLWGKSSAVGGSRRFPSGNRKAKGGIPGKMRGQGRKTAKGT